MLRQESAEDICMFERRYHLRFGHFSGWFDRFSAEPRIHVEWEVKQSQKTLLQW
jgi:hypothetical protein